MHQDVDVGVVQALDAAVVLALRLHGGEALFVRGHVRPLSGVRDVISTESRGEAGLRPRRSRRARSRRRGCPRGWPRARRACGPGPAG